MQGNVTDILASWDTVLVTKPPPAGLTLIKHEVAIYAMPFWFQH